MYLVKETFSYTLEIKKSTFIAFITPYDNFQPLRQQLKQQHPKSRHIVYAFRYLNEHKQIIEDLSDDGEPKGSSAPPILSVLRGEEIINSAILVVRYFGGIRLGIGGLVRAYGNATKEVIKQANLIEYIAKEVFTFETSYPLVGKYEHFLNSMRVSFDREFLASSVQWKVLFSQEEKEKFMDFRRV